MIFLLLYFSVFIPGCHLVTAFSIFAFKKPPIAVACFNFYFKIRNIKQNATEFG
jgi:hypothetical protein